MIADRDPDEVERVEVAQDGEREIDEGAMALLNISALEARRIDDEEQVKRGATPSKALTPFNRDLEEDAPRLIKARVAELSVEAQSLLSRRVERRGPRVTLIMLHQLFKAP